MSDEQILCRIARHVRLALGELEYQLDREGADTTRLVERLRELERRGLVESLA